MYGDEKGDDIIDLNKIKVEKIDPCVFRTKEKLEDAQNYFIESINFLKIENCLDNICSE